MMEWQPIETAPKTGDMLLWEGSFTLANIMKSMIVFMLMILRRHFVIQPTGNHYLNHLRSKCHGMATY